MEQAEQRLKKLFNNSQNMQIFAQPETRIFPDGGSFKLRVPISTLKTFFKYPNITKNPPIFDSFIIIVPDNEPIYVHIRK